VLKSADIGLEPAVRGYSGARSFGLTRAEYRWSVSSRLDKSWRVLASHQTPEGDRCVDVFLRPDGSFGFEEFRRDPEDMGTWTPVAYFSGRAFTTEDETRTAAKHTVPWLSRLLDH